MCFQNRRNQEYVANIMKEREKEKKGTENKQTYKTRDNVHGQAGQNNKRREWMLKSGSIIDNSCLADITDAF